MKHVTKYLPLLSLLPMLAVAAPHVSETLTLKKGWNAVYIESTADNPSCEEFFRDTPVIGVAAYQSDADASTAQYDESGKVIMQAPIPYLTWIRGEESASTLKSIIGGNTFVIYATNATTIAFNGVPAVPKMTWRKVSSTETNEFLNVAGVSSASDKVSVDAYFGEGPFGMSSTGRAIYSASGEDTEEGPDLNPVKGAFGRPATIAGGKAYALTATRAGEWPGIVGVLDSDVTFGEDANFASIRVRNGGTSAREFSFRVEASSTGEELPVLSRQLSRVDAVSALQFTNVEESVAWTVSLDPDEVTEQFFSIDRSKLEAGNEYGAILVIEDLGGSMMRVRVPITVVPVSQEDVAYPTGLWYGEIALMLVSGIDDETPTLVPAGGTMRMNVMMHIDTNGTCRLLQRVAAGVDTNGVARLFRELSSVPAEVESAKRFSTVMMSVDTPVVEAAEGSEFGDEIGFSWAIAPDARDNPFRHAWHPDHDGKKADYSGYLPAGDDFELYKNPIKPELWSITNKFTLSWHEQANKALPVHYQYNASETTTGIVEWEVRGLTAKSPIVSSGVFALRRVFKAKELE